MISCGTDIRPLETLLLAICDIATRLVVVNAEMSHFPGERFYDPAPVLLCCGKLQISDFHETFFHQVLILRYGTIGISA